MIISGRSCGSCNGWKIGLRQNLKLDAEACVGSWAEIFSDAIMMFKIIPIILINISNPNHREQNPKKSFIRLLLFKRQNRLSNATIITATCGWFRFLFCQTWRQPRTSPFCALGAFTMMCSVFLSSIRSLNFCSLFSVQIKRFHAVHCSLVNFIIFWGFLVWVALCFILVAFFIVSETKE